MSASPVVKLENPMRGLRSRGAQRLETGRTVVLPDSGVLLLIQSGIKSGELGCLDPSG